MSHHNTAPRLLEHEPFQAAGKAVNRNAAVTRFAVRFSKAWAALAIVLLTETPAHALHGNPETMDAIAHYMAIFLLFFVPLIGVTVFLLIHILPEKLAERRGHPQLAAIKVLCLLSLLFGDMLWPLAWIWAFSKPTLHKLAYGHDKVDHDGNPVHDDAETLRKQIQSMKAQLDALEAKSEEAI